MHRIHRHSLDTSSISERHPWNGDTLSLARLWRHTVPSSADWVIRPQSPPTRMTKSARFRASSGRMPMGSIICRTRWTVVGQDFGALFTSSKLKPAASMESNTTHMSNTNTKLASQTSPFHPKLKSLAALQAAEIFGKQNHRREPLSRKHVRTKALKDSRKMKPS